MLDMSNGRSIESMHYQKYRAQKVDTPDGVFDSKKEYKRWLELKRMQEAGEIKYLTRQVKYELIPVQKLEGKVLEYSVNYFADFTYYYKDELVVEDVKGFKTPEYIIKRKLMLQQYGIRIHEV